MNTLEYFLLRDLISARFLRFISNNPLNKHPKENKHRTEPNHSSTSYKNRPSLTIDICKRHLNTRRRPPENKHVHRSELSRFFSIRPTYPFPFRQPLYTHSSLKGASQTFGTTSVNGVTTAETTPFQPCVLTLTATIPKMCRRKLLEFFRIWGYFFILNWLYICISKCELINDISL